MPKVKKSTKKDPPEKVLADLAKKYPQLLNLTAPPQRDDKLRQGEERSVAEKSADVLRALAQPINYMREVGEGNYVPTQAELEAKGISPMEQAIALANPADHIYAALAASDVVNDPNYKSEDGVSYGSPGLVSLIAGSAPQRVSRDLDKSIKVLKEAGIKTFGELNSKDLSSLSETAKEAAKDVARVIENANKLGPALRNETGLNREFITPNAPVPFNLRNYLMNEGSTTVLQYDPSKPLSADPFMKDMLDYNSDLFSRDYLTSYRGVTAENAGEAERFLTDVGGGGKRSMGEGVYVTPQLEKAKYFADPKQGLFKSGEGYVGKVRQQLPFYGYENVLRDLARREFKGHTYDIGGFSTAPAERVIRQQEAAPGALEVRDLVKLNDLVKSGNTLLNRGTIPKYYNEESLEFGETPYQYIRSFFKSKDFNQGGKFTVKKKAKEGMRVKKANQGMVFGDPVKHQAKTRALGPDDRIIYVPAGEGAEEDPENYLNLAKLDSILESSYDGVLPFGAFRDQVRKVEAGPHSKDPYRQRQEVEVNGEVLEVGVGRGAYQFDYPTAQTAYKRLKSIADKRDLDYPDLSDEDLRDVSKLDPEIQDMLFTAHFAKDPATSVEKVLMDDENWADQWQIGHYKGDKDRREHFRSLQ